MSPVATGLQQAVSNTSVLTFLTLSAHWGVVGSDFFQLHAALNEQYEALFDTIDLLAERMRALDAPVKVCLAEMETQAGMPCMRPTLDTRGMMEVLIGAHTKNVGDLKALCTAARLAGDAVTENMILTVIEAEQKTLWMLKSYVR